MHFDDFVAAASTATLADASTPAAREHADAVEFRMDLADEPLAQLADYDADLPVIATNRVEWEGGEAPEGEQRRADLLAAAEHDAVEVVDVELEALRRGEAAGLPEQVGDDADVLVSVHDFDRTPAIEDLRSLLDACLEFGDVGKLVTTAETVDDVLPVLSVTREFAGQGHTVATMAMGEPGRHSRAVAPVYGSSIGYAPVDPAEATAPGQYDVATLDELVADLSSGPDA